MKRINKGFTLIELLVVIAIISILASVVLANLNSARAKGIDAAIKGTVSNTRAQAALFYDSNNDKYENVCIAVGGIGPMIQNAAEKLTPIPPIGIDGDDFIYDAAGGIGSSVCHDSDTEWAAIVSLKVPSVPSSGWCVDYTGASKEATSLPANVTVCP